MDGWWQDVEQEIMTCLRDHGPASPGLVARRLGMSEASATSLIATLACEGKVRIGLVDCADVPSLAVPVHARRRGERSSVQERKMA
jgi:hypothetical protein